MWYFLGVIVVMLGIIIYGLYRGKYKKSRRFNIYWISRYTAPAIIVVLGFKIFIADWSFVPTPSMWPTVAPKEFVFLTKYDYNIFAEPYLKHRILSIAGPKRGDVVTFLYPLDENITYLKRVVAIGGDTIEYDQNKQLIVTTKENNVITYSYTKPEIYLGSSTVFSLSRESIENKTYKTARILRYTPLLAREFNNFDDFKGCDYKTIKGFKCHVPAGEYFVMGDNRDQSLDSRYWGFVPADKILAHARYTCAVDPNKNPKFDCRPL